MVHSLPFLSLATLAESPNDMRERETRDRREGPSSSSDGETSGGQRDGEEAQRKSREEKSREEKSRRKKGGRKGEKKRSGSFTSVRIKRSSASIIINQDVNNEGTDGSESGRARCGRDTRSLAIESVGSVRCVAAFRRRYATVCISARTAPHRAAPHTAVRGS